MVAEGIRKTCQDGLGARGYVACTLRAGKIRGQGFRHIDDAIQKLSFGYGCIVQTWWNGGKRRLVQEPRRFRRAAGIVWSDNNIGAESAKFGSEAALGVDLD